MRDTVKTLVGLVIIAVIVVATFLYGNSQRQAQLKHDQQIKNAQAKSTDSQLLAKASPAATTTPAPSTSPSSSPATNTAPVQTPQSNSLQGGSSPTPTPSSTPKATPTPSASPTPVVVAANGQSGTGTPLPQTGPSMGGIVGVAAIIFAIIGVRYSRRALLDAVRSNRYR